MYDGTKDGTNTIDKSDGTSSDYVPLVDGKGPESMWLNAIAAVVPYWILKWGYWPVLVLPFEYTIGSLSFIVHIGVDLLTEKSVEALSLPTNDPDEYASSSSYIDENVDMLIMGALIAGIVALYPLCVASEALARSIVGSWTPAQIAIVVATVLLAFSVVFFSTLYIESSLNAGRMDHGNAAFRYQCLLIAILFTVVGFNEIPFVHSRVTSYLNDMAKEAAGKSKWIAIKSGTKSKVIILMLVVYIYIAAYFAALYGYHLVRHYQTEV
ncbi:MAG: hypothetical protein P1Q69_12280 [Candidatus Thorarchaeota archaeon]|nr:hypothetical protein [Candidatus Thorarchaeota archaeon]